MSPSSPAEDATNLQTSSRSTPNAQTPQNNHEQTKPYQYRPLESPTTIRLLVLLPGHGSQPLRAKLRHINLNRYEDPSRYNDEPCKCCNCLFLARKIKLRIRTVPYEALSYVWGDPTYSRSLHTAQGVIALTPNLWDLLRHIRLPDSKRVVWADGVCINQKDLQERSQQVSLMGKIYRRALQVLVWLGPDHNRHAARTFQNLKTLPQHVYTPNYTIKVKETLSELGKCEWFGRLWVVQELLVSRKAVVAWGDEQIGFRYLYDPLWIYQSRINMDGPSWAGQTRGRYDYLELIEVLDWTRGCRCTDERDRVYAILGLKYSKITGAQQIITDIKPNYTKNVEDVFFELASLLVKHGHLNWLLSRVYHDLDWNPVSKHMLSWFPDWSKAGVSIPFPHACSALRTSIQTLFTRSTSHYSANTESSTRTLRVSGFNVSRIVEVTEGDLFESPLATLTEFWTRRLKRIRALGQEELRIFVDITLLNILTHGTVDYAGHRDYVHLVQGLFNSGELSEPDHNDLLDNQDAREMMLALWRSAEVMHDHGHVPHEVSKDYDFVYDSAKAMKRLPSLLWKGRALFMTNNGLLGLGPGAMQYGDLLVMLSGVSLPVILRKHGEWYRFVGNTACIPGLDQVVDSVAEERGYEQELFIMV